MSYPIATNPYVVGPPVSGEHYYGRQEVFRLIKEYLEIPANRLIVLHGQRRAGKTSVLLELHFNRLPPERYCAVRVDVQSQAETQFSLAVHELAMHIAESLGMEKPDLGDYWTDADYFLQTFLPKALNTLEDRRLVIMIDEFDSLVDYVRKSNSTNTANVRTRFVRMMQTILNDSIFDRIVFVLVGHLACFLGLLKLLDLALQVSF